MSIRRAPVSGIQVVEELSCNAYLKLLSNLRPPVGGCATMNRARRLLELPSIQSWRQYGRVKGLSMEQHPMYTIQTIQPCGESHPGAERIGIRSTFETVHIHEASFTEHARNPLRALAVLQARA
jgi:hypothetical protein